MGCKEPRRREKECNYLSRAWLLLKKKKITFNVERVSQFVIPADKVGNCTQGPRKLQTFFDMTRQVKFKMDQHYNTEGLYWRRS